MKNTPITFVFLMLLAILIGATNSQEKTKDKETQQTDARTWTDSTGHYKIKADLIARDESRVVLQRADKSLVMVEISQLSDADKKYLQSKAKEDEKKPTSKWTLANGLTVNGTIVEYGRRDVTIKRRKAKIYVNDRVFDNLPEVYQKMVPRIVGHFENKKIEDKNSLAKWVRLQKGVPRTFVCDGVLLELENGDLYGIPIFFFSKKDQAILNPGLQKFIASVEAKDRENAQRLKEQSEYNLQLKAQAAAREREKAQFRNFARLQLQLQGYSGGLFDMWEVQLYPPNRYGYPVYLVVPARDSRQASNAALRKYPKFKVGSVKKVRRRY